jgi:solute carrier family 25 (mitochondrial carnitine/acylcarnitine transporter), member 20/29
MNIKEYIAGTIGGCIGTIISHPFDTLRIHLQTNSTKNIFNKGISSFYKGITPPLLGISLEKSIVFGTFYNLEKNPILKNKYKKYNLYLNGFIAGFLSTIIVTPVERFKIALQTNQNIYNIKINTIYSGWLSTILRESPGYAIYFKTYEMLKKENDSKIKTFINGSLSGMSAWFFIYPSDKVKTLVQNQNNTYSNIINNIYKLEGLKGFYKGFSLALLRCIPLHGGVFVGYNYIINLL